MVTKEHCGLDEMRNVIFSIQNNIFLRLAGK